MDRKVIPISNSYPNEVPFVPEKIEEPTGTLLDAHARPLRDLRISVTDRCNFRCIYCMPKQVFGKDFVFLPHSSVLRFEEITRIARIFVGQGVEKIRLTGGEPLLRKDIEQLIAQLGSLKTVEGKALDITLTTNGSLLAKKAQRLYDAGLKRLTVSLDALDDSIFQRMNDVQSPVADVLKGLEVAHKVGFDPIKINMVVKRGTNDHQILPMARHFRDTRFIPRFIEYMDVGTSNNWKLDEVLPSSEVIRRIHAEMPLKMVDPNYSGETAQRWIYQDSGGEIGVIASVTQAFCHECSRIRLSTEGKIYTCLFATQGHDLRALIRNDYSDEQIGAAIAHIWGQREDRYSELRGKASQQALKKIEMSYIGG